MLRGARNNLADGSEPDALIGRQGTRLPVHRPRGCSLFYPKLSSGPGSLHEPSRRPAPRGLGRRIRLKLGTKCALVVERRSSPSRHMVMSSSRKTPRKPPSSTVSVRGTASWLALLTATTLGSRPGVVRADVRSGGGSQAVSSNRPHRLVVQVYPQRAFVAGRIAPWARPTASAQRAVTEEDLVLGVPVHLVDFGCGSVDTHDPGVVVAWVEEGAPDLEVDGMGARPRHDVPCAVAQVSPRARASVTLRFVSRGVA